LKSRKTQNKGVLLLHLLHFPVRTLGPGIRAGLWFQGCTIHCPGCVTPESWAFDPQSAVPLDAVTGRIGEFAASSPRAEGLTISGGEPFDQPDALFYIMRAARRAGLDDILIFSGYETDALTARYPELPQLASALVGGPFKLGRTTDSAWKGSENQSLSVWNAAHARRYEEWAGEKTRKLQLAKRARGGENKIFLIGIPRQEDTERLRKRWSNHPNEI
jgi:anaerobic ribonucleoside-triphosphate reductase activating protein